MRGKITDFFRMWVWAAIAVVLLVIIGRPEQVLVVVYKGSLVCIAAFVGYWIDRNLFATRLPRDPEYASDQYGQASQAAAYRRAIIVAAVILAFALGL